MPQTELSKEDALREENARLRLEIDALQHEKADLELLMETNIAFSDSVEEDLLDKLEATKKELSEKILKLREEIASLHQELIELKQEKADLELLIEMNLEYSDYIEDDLLNKIESTLRESEKRFRVMSETIPVPIIVSRLSDGMIVYANKPASELFGLPVEELSGHKAYDFCNPPDRRLLLKILRTQGYISNYELQGKRSDGSPFWGAFSAQPMRFNEESCLLSAIHDLSERKRAEEEVHALNQELEQRVEERTAELQAANQALQESLHTLRMAQEQLVQAEKMVALGGLVAGVAHEINTPVGIGVTAASYLEQKTRDLEKRYQTNQMKRSDLENYLETAIQSTVMILQNLQRAAEQIQSFKQVAVDQTSGEKRQFKLKAYIDDLLISLHPKFKHAQHTVTVDCPENIELTSYPGAFSQIFTNLIINSLTHGFDHKEQGEIHIYVTSETALRIRFSDNGQGIAEKELSRIFEPFYTTRRGQGGTGLGLHIVYNLVTQKLKGNIRCESTPDKGTTFIIEIPIENKKSDNT